MFYLHLLFVVLLLYHGGLLRSVLAKVDNLKCILEALGNSNIVIVFLDYC